MTLVWWTGVFGALLLRKQHANKFIRIFVVPFDFAGLFYLGVLSRHRFAPGKKIINEKIVDLFLWSPEFF